MTRPLVAGIVAASLALTSLTAAPARAEMNTQTRNLLIGLAATAIIAGAIDHNRRAGTVTVTPPAPEPVRGHGASRELPASCLVEVPGRRNTIRLFSERCLDRSYRFAARLPDYCAVRVFTRSGPINGYDPRCLRDAGFSTDRRVEWGNRGWGQGDWDRRDWERGRHSDH